MFIGKAGKGTLLIWCLEKSREETLRDQLSHRSPRAFDPALAEALEKCGILIRLWLSKAIEVLAESCPC